jgi:hypothetical protein|tara:strand:+ start:1559 stop:2089 length:531 start_codon:yes stop_codon:yes gene_type:complete
MPLQTPKEKLMNTTKQEHRPWHKEPMMLLVIGLPLISVCWGMVMLYLAINTQDSLVNDSYYKDGVNYTEDLKHDEQAKRLQIAADVTFTTDEIHMNLRGYLDEKPNTLQLQLIHPTLQDRDETVLMQRIEDGSYVGINDLELPQKRHVWLLSGEQKWRIRHTEIIEENKAFTLGKQ